MTSAAYPGPRPPADIVHPWNWRRLLLALVSAFAVGLGVCWAATVEHLWRWAPAPKGLANPAYDPGLVGAIVTAVGGAALFVLVARRARLDRFALLRSLSVGARRTPGSVSPTDRAALFVSTAAPRLHLAATLVGSVAFVTLFAVVFRTWALALALGVISAYQLQRVASLRVRVGLDGARVSSALGWKLGHVGADRGTSPLSITEIPQL